MADNGTSKPTPDASLYLEAWKQSIQVQMHFNTIEMQIRNIAVTVLTAVFGASALVYNQVQKSIADASAAGKDPSLPHYVEVLWIQFSPADMIMVGGLIAWLSFYFMDRWWYHRLLIGAVRHAQTIETDIGKRVPDGQFLGLSARIGVESAIKLSKTLEIHSSRKIDLFYGFVSVVLLLVIFFVF